jgi:6-phospho-beta-glucosidase
MGMLKDLGIDESNYSRARLDTLGLNHLTWHRGFSLDGEDLWPQVLEASLKKLRASDHPAWDVSTIESLRMLPNPYLQYFYYTDRKLEEQEKWPPSRAERVMEIEAGLLKQYAEPDRTTPPEGLMQRGGAYYSTLATQVLNSHYNDLGEVHAVNTRNNGAVPGWPADWVLEMPCVIDASGVHPLPAEPLPPACFGVVAAVKSYEKLTVEAAVHGDRNAAYQAMLVNPLGPSADKVDEVLDDLLETNRKYLPQFFSAESAP